MTRIAAVALMAFLVAAPAGAAPNAALDRLAPEYSSSEPADGEKLHKAPDQVTVTFSEPLDPSSEMIVEDHCGNRLDDRDVEVSLNEMSVGIAKKPSGHYMVTYAAVGIGGATGTNQGRFSFTVHAGEPCGDRDHGQHRGGGDMGGHDQHRGGRSRGHQDGHSGGRTHAGARHGGGHQQTSHPAGVTDHGDHPAGRPISHGKHQSAGRDASAHRPDGHRSHGSDSGGLPDVAAGETPLPNLSPDSAAVLLALLLCAAFGALGGWVLRVSARK